MTTVSRHRLARHAAVTAAVVAGVLTVWVATTPRDPTSAVVTGVGGGLFVAAALAGTDRAILRDGRHGRVWSGVSAGYAYLGVATVGAVVLAAVTGEFGRTATLLPAVLLVFSPVALLVALAGALVQHRP